MISIMMISVIVVAQRVRLLEGQGHTRAARCARVGVAAAARAGAARVASAGGIPVGLKVRAASAADAASRGRAGIACAAAGAAAGVVRPVLVLVPVLVPVAALLAAFALSIPLPLPILIAMRALFALPPFLAVPAAALARLVLALVLLARPI